ncbi:MAG: hypothetical protein O3A46_04790 [Candidatus Poribacteria bacterium]|nr:hypothetical protein [Candidatus Poribacteria bacterium]
MSDTPIIIGRDGFRWAVVSAEAFAARFEHATTSLVAETFEFPQNRLSDGWRALTELQRLPEGHALRGYFLRGDAHHLSDFYDITDDVQTDENVAARLAGRTVARVTAVGEPLPHWWSDGIEPALESFARESNANGVLLAEDWTPTFDAPNRFPFCERVIDRFERRAEMPFREAVAWLFVTGEPSVRVRRAYAGAMRELARESLARWKRVAPLGVAFALTGKRRWWFAPTGAAEVGATPFVFAHAVEADKINHPAMRRRLSEVAAGFGEALASAPTDPRLTTFHAHGIVGEGSPIPPDAEPAPSVLLIESREDGWAHAWDDETRAIRRFGDRFTSWLETLGISYATVDETLLRDFLKRFQPALLALLPTRGLSAPTLELLEGWTNAKRHVLAVEPLPTLLDGKPSGRLEDWLRERRVRHIEADGDEPDKRLGRLLQRRNAVAPFHVVRRDDGFAPRGLFRRFLRDSAAEYAVFHHADPDSALLIERTRETPVQRWTGAKWEPAPHWHANGFTYAEIELVAGRYAYVKFPSVS